jgi:predicted nucleic acid-binding Zn ribbon protein
VTRHRNGPRAMTWALDSLRDELAPATVLASVQHVWPEVVGPAIAAEAAPAAERGGVLTVSCSAAVWAQELDLMGPAIIERLNDRLGGSPIQRLRCVSV